MTKIAIVTDDGRTISAHFGRAAYYAVITVEDGREVGREQRAKPAHQHGHGHQHEHSGATGTIALQMEGGPAAPDTIHGPMIEAIQDCQVAVARGMGRPMYERLRGAGIEPVLTAAREIDEAVRLYLAGELTDHPERVH